MTFEIMNIFLNEQTTDITHFADIFHYEVTKHYEVQSILMMLANLLDVSSLACKLNQGFQLSCPGSLKVDYSKNSCNQIFDIELGWGFVYIYLYCSSYKGTVSN